MRQLARIRWLFSSEQGVPDRMIARWIVLRGLGLIYFSAFFSLVFQIRGLIGPLGILPAGSYLQAVAKSFGPFTRIWFAPTLLWLASGPHMLMAICWIGMAAALLVTANIWPRATLLVCFVCFLSFVSAAEDFSGYQSDGMLLEAGFIALFFYAGGVSSRSRQYASALARQPLPAAMGVVPHLLRIRLGQAAQRRPGMASSDGYG